MAREKNPDRSRMFTPKGTLKWPKLTEVDLGTKQYPKEPPGEYNVRLVLDTRDPAVQEFMAKLDTLMERSEELAKEKFAELPVKARKKLEAEGVTSPRPDKPYSPIYDEKTEEETGEIEFRAKMRAGGVIKNGPKKGQKWSAKPDLFDAKGKPLPKGVQVWGGSVAKVNFDTEPYFVEGTGKYGLQRMLNAAQIVELVSSGGQRSASSYGFGEEEGFDASEYSAPEDDETADKPDTGADDADDDNPDF